MGVSKNMKESSALVDKTIAYSLTDAAGLMKSISKAKFDASVDIAVKLGVDPKQANQMVRGVVTLPHGTGKDVKVLALVTADKEDEAKEAGADYVGLEDYIEKLKEGWTDVDVIITMPSVMGKLGTLGRILGPRGLMPNPKTGTVTPNVAKAVEVFKKGKVEIKNDKLGNVHLSIGKVSFDEAKLAENLDEVIAVLTKAKPSSSKGEFIKNVHMSSTMGPSISVDINI